MSEDEIGNGISNETRAEWASRALHGYRKATGEDSADIDDIVDLIADLGHYCKKEGIDFCKVLESAKMHFDAEQEGVS